VTLGTVVEGFLWSQRARSGGGITVDISDTEACCATPKAIEVHQSRSYAWVSGHYRQVAGPTAWVPHRKPIDLHLGKPSVSWHETSNGQHTGTLTVTVTNSSDSATFPALRPHSSVTLHLTITWESEDYAEYLYLVELGAVSIGGDANESDNHQRIPGW
jgi:hypothetical protein